MSSAYSGQKTFRNCGKERCSMFVMTYSQARQNLSSFLDRAKADGQTLINRADGSQFIVTPVDSNSISDSPLYELYDYAQKIDEPFQKLSIDQMIQMLNEDREDRADKILNDAACKTAADFFNSFNK